MDHAYAADRYVLPGALTRWTLTGTALLFLAMAAGGRPAPPAATAQAMAHKAYLPATLAAAALGTDARPGGTLVIAQGAEPDTLYLYGGSMLAATHVLNSLYDGPIDSLGYDYQPVILDNLPRLEDGDGSAELDYVSVEPGEFYVDPESSEVVTATERVTDLLQATARFRLVVGVTWEDGKPVTAADSVFSQFLACHPDTPTSKVLCERTAAYTALDERTVEWQGLPGFADPAYYTHFYTPLPRHQRGSDGRRMDETPSEDILYDEVFARQPLSYGPFRIVEWSYDDPVGPPTQIALARNPHYWRAGEGLPLLDGVVHRYFLDSDSARAALEAGEVHVATQDALDLSQHDALEEARQAGKVVPYYVAGPVWEHIDFNLDPEGNRPPLGACLDVRRAMALGTNRQEMVDMAQAGRGEVLDSFVPRGHWAAPPAGTADTYGYEPDRARALLADLGFVDLDGDGYREAADDIRCTIYTDPEGTTKEQVIARGTPLRLILSSTAGSRLRMEVALLFQHYMKEIGVQVDLEFIDALWFFEDGPDGPLFGRRFHLALFAWLTRAEPPANLYRCSAIARPENDWAGNNETGWCHPDFEHAAGQAAVTLEREPARLLYNEALRTFMHDVPVLPLFLRAKVMATTPDVRGFRPDPTASSETWNVEEWGFARAVTEP